MKFGIHLELITKRSQKKLSVIGHYLRELQAIKQLANFFQGPVTRVNNVRLRSIFFCDLLVMSSKCIPNFISLSLKLQDIDLQRQRRKILK